MMEGGGMFVQVSPDSVAAAGETVTWVPQGRLAKWQSQLDEVEVTPALAG